MDVANGYRPHMTRKMVLRLVRTDPEAPQAGAEHRLRDGLLAVSVALLPRPTADPGQAPAEEPQAPYRPAPVAEAPPAPAPGPAPEPGERLTQAGLPRRVPRANMAPGMVASQQADAPPPPPSQPTGRSPDEVRSMLSSYRTGIERGRTVAGGTDQGERPPDSP
jgi:hypothetical protein